MNTLIATRYLRGLSTLSPRLHSTPHTCAQQETPASLAPSSPTLNQEEGQSTIEFIITFILGLGIVFLFLSLGLNYNIGYMVHNASYEAARVYLTHDNSSYQNSSSESSAEQAAYDKLLEHNLQRYNIQLPPQGQIIPNATIPEYAGVIFNYDTPFSFFSKFGGDLTLELQSEAFLGREPSRAACRQRTCDAMRSLLEEIGFSVPQGDCSSAHHFITLFDNGC